jgi:DNA-binding NarL/FixJ family response regulator
MVGSNGTREPGRIRVLLAIFEFPLLCSAFRAALGAEPDIDVVGSVAGPDALLAAVVAADADVCISECQPLGSPTCSSFGSIETLKAARPGMRVIALECRCGAQQFGMALKAGADGYLTREATEHDVVAAVRAVIAGNTYVSPPIVTRMVNAYVLHTPESGPADPYEALTEREREVLLLAAIGRTNREVAHSLSLSEQTIHHERARIMEKLGLHDRVDLLKYAIRRGLLEAADL